MPSPAKIDTCRWLTDDGLTVYTEEYQRSGFQGGLQWYRTRMDGSLRANPSLFGQRTIDVPSLFISGSQDWGAYQVPRGLELMQNTACTRMEECYSIDGAGHWVQQENPEQVVKRILEREFVS